MPKPARLLAALVLALALPLLARTARAGDVDGALRFVPQEAFFAAGAHGDRLQRSPHYRALIDLLLDGKTADVDALKKATGVDLRRDLRAVVVALVPEPRRRGEPVIIAEVKVDEASLLAFMSNKGRKATTKQAAGGRMHVLSDKSALAVRGRFVIAGDEGAVRSALAQRGPDKELAALLRGVQQRDVFFAGRPTDALRNELGREKRQLKELRAVSGGGQIDKQIRLDATAVMSNAAAAESLRNQLKGALLVARVAPEVRNTGLASLMDGVSVDARGKELRMKLHLDEAQIKKLLQLLQLAM